MTTFFPLSSFTVSNRWVAAAAIAVLMGATPAFATTETAPSSWELTTPTSVSPAEPTVNAVTPDTSGGAVAAGPMTTQPTTAAVSRPANDDPCPTPRAARTERPDDLAQVQEDIDRFTLCVQRAQLLERLNDSASRMTESADSALGYAGMGGSAPASLPRGGAMPPLPAGALGGLDVSPAPIAPVLSNTTTTTTTSSTAPSGEVVTQTSTETVTHEGPRWLIREIFGSVTDMQARLVTAQGDEVLVRQGTALKDGGVVTTITPSGVSVRSKGGVSTLEWSGD